VTGAPEDVPIRDESIRLGQFLKLANLVDSGSDAKPLLMNGAVQVNGEVETVGVASCGSGTSWWWVGWGRGLLGRENSQGI
jgi:hypothetical protein